MQLPHTSVTICASSLATVNILTMETFPPTPPGWRLPMREGRNLLRPTREGRRWGMRSQQVATLPAGGFRRVRLFRTVIARGYTTRHEHQAFTIWGDCLHEGNPSAARVTGSGNSCFCRIARVEGSWHTGKGEGVFGRAAAGGVTKGGHSCG